MRYVKAVVAMTMALLAVLSLLALSRADAQTSAPNNVGQQISYPYNNHTTAPAVNTDLWLMPDYDRGGVWVEGQFSGADQPPLPIKNNEDVLSKEGDRFLGWWEGSQIVSATHDAKGIYYKLLLPGLNLQPEDILDIRLASGIVLDDMLLPQASNSVSAPLSFSTEIHGDHDRIILTDFSPSTRPFTLSVPFYPYEKAIDLTLTPLLVETLMRPEASAISGSTHRHFRGGDYTKTGFQGRGQTRIRVRTIEDDPERDAVALVTALREDRRAATHGGFDAWSGGLGYVLERSLDFPSFPSLFPHKKTAIEVVMREMSYTLQSDMPVVSLEAPFTLQAWQQKREEQVDQLLERYAFHELSQEAEEQRLLISVGEIILGPQDVLTLTLENALWESFSTHAHPDTLIDHWRKGNVGPERNGFTAVYRGPRSFRLDIHYTPHSNLFARQSAMRLRGLSRVLEYHWSEFAINIWNSIGIWTQKMAGKIGLPAVFFGLLAVTLFSLALLGVFWVPYQRTIPGREFSDLRMKTHALLRTLLMLVFLAVLIAFANSRGWDTLLAQWKPSFIGESTWSNMPRPFAALMVCGAWLILLRWDTLRSRQGLSLLVVFGICLILEVMLNSLYPSRILNAVKYGSITGVLSGAVSLALLPLVIMLFWQGWWVEKKEKSEQEKRQLHRKHQNLHAFSFAALAAATFEVTDASLFALAVLFMTWVLLSRLVDEARPLESKASTSDAAEAPSSPESESVPSPAVGEPSLLGKLRSLVTRITILTGRFILGVPKQEVGEKPTSQPLAPKEEAVPSEETPPDGKSEAPETFDSKLLRVRHPVFVGTILVVAVVLAQDPLLRSQLASFTQHAPLGQTWLLQFLDPLARLATTLVPCLAMVLLVVLFDSTLEHRRYTRTGKTSIPLDTYFKVLLFACLFLIFFLGVGGLDLFAGSLDLKLSDRIIYYITVPLLTSVWLDLTKGPGDLLNQLIERLVKAQNWIRVLLILLSILLPRLISAPTTEQVDRVINTLQSLQ